MRAGGSGGDQSDFTARCRLPEAPHCVLANVASGGRGAAAAQEKSRETTWQAMARRDAQPSSQLTTNTRSDFESAACV